ETLGRLPQSSIRPTIPGKIARKTDGAAVAKRNIGRVHFRSPRAVERDSRAPAGCCFPQRREVNPVGIEGPPTPVGDQTQYLREGTGDCRGPRRRDVSARLPARPVSGRRRVLFGRGQYNR